MYRITLSAALVLVSLSNAFAQTGKPGAHFIENWDLDGDGSVTLAEIKERRDTVFYTFDTDEDGVLTVEEYSYFDQARANDMAEQGEGKGKGKAGEQRVQEGMTLAFNDSDGDGAVSKDEFIEKSADWLALIDRDGDALVTSNDFGPK